MSNSIVLAHRPSIPRDTTDRCIHAPPLIPSNSQHYLNRHMELGLSQESWNQDNQRVPEPEELELSHKLEPVPPKRIGEGDQTTTREDD